MLRGVESVTSGYAGGTMANSTYEKVSAEMTGHAEVVQVVFDEQVVKLEQLLAVFFTTHDPTSQNQQGADRGTQYRSAIYYTTTEQQKIIAQFIAQQTTDQVFARPIVTEVKPLEQFYPAEQYHQNYYRSNTDQPYCQAVINPKLAKLRQSYKHLLKT